MLITHIGLIYACLFRALLQLKTNTADLASFCKFHAL